MPPVRNGHDPPVSRPAAGGGARLWSRVLHGLPSRTAALVDRLDTWQQSRTWASVPVAVVVKYRADGGGSWATLLAHYGFLSLFPLLLVLVTALGYVLSGNAALQQRVLDTVLADVPVLGSQIRADVTSLRGNAGATAVGLVLAAYGGLAVLRTARAAMDVMWAVPRQSLGAYLRGHARVAAVGAALLLATLLAAVSGSLTTGLGSLPGTAKVLSLTGSALLSFGVFLVAFRVLTEARPAWLDVLPGAVVGAAGWTVLHAVGGLYVRHVVGAASLAYGTFAVVIGLLAWLYLQARLLLLAAELNVVLSRGLWPRSLTG